MRLWLSRLTTRPGIREGVAWLLCGLGSLAFLYPALAHGIHLGPYGLLNSSPITRPTAPFGIHNLESSDLLMEMTPWAWWNWAVIHSGHFPLWNPRTLLGLPEFFNFQSAALSVPSLISYLFPRQAVLLVIVGTKLLIASTGLYFAGRVWQWPRWVALFAALTFAFSGSFAGWLGWPMTGVFAWVGWALALMTLGWRSPHRFWPTVGLGGVLAAAVYGGHPGSLILLAVALLLYAGVLAYTWPPTADHGIGPALGAFGVACLLALGLTAPLLIPGIPLLLHTIEPATALHFLPGRISVTLVTAHYFGDPLTRWLGPSNYYETAADIGPIAAGFALLAIGWGWHTRWIRGLTGLVLLLGLLIYAPGPLGLVWAHWTVLGLIGPTRWVMALDAILACLAAWGVWQWAQRWQAHTLGLWPSRVFWALLVLYLGLAARMLWAPLPTSTDVALRLLSLWWPVCLTLFTLMVLHLARHTAWSSWTPGWVAALLAVQTGWLLVSSAPLTAYAHRGYVATPSTQAIARVVGTQAIGLAHAGPPDSQAYDWPGWIPETNLPYGIDEFAAYDPTVPAAYDTTWATLTHHSARATPYRLPLYIPSIDSATVARAYGIAWVLSAPPSPQALRHRLHRLGATLSLPRPIVQAWTALWAIDAQHPRWQAAIPWATPHAVSARLQQVLRHPRAFPSALRPTFQTALRLLRTHPQWAAAIWHQLPEPAPAGFQPWVITSRFTLSHVRHSAQATVPVGTVAPLQWHSDAQFTVRVTTPRPTFLTMHLTTVPGWHVTRAGHPLSLRSPAPLVWQVAVPAGTSRLVWTYRPRGWVIGEAIAAGTLVGIAGAMIFWERSRRRNRRASSPAPCA